MTVKHMTAMAVGMAAALLMPQMAAGAHSGGDVQRAIRQSIATYSGSCPCPYNVDRAGRRCGARSAHSKPGGAAPLCYAADVQRRR
jgi:hypothetical protein